MTFTLEDLKEAIQLFSTNHCGYLTENCIVALEKNNHQSGCILKVFGDDNDDVILTWSTQVENAEYKESKKFVEHGAEAISFFIANTYTEFQVIEEAIIGTGIDYWLGYSSKHPNYDPDNFFSARLEISGILKESDQNKTSYRVKKKKKQTIPSDNSTLPAYISIVEFSNPKAYFAKK